MELSENAPNRLDSICLLLVERLNSNDDAAKMSIIDMTTLESIGVSSLNKGGLWLNDQYNNTESPLMSCRGSIAGATSILRSLSYSNSVQCNRASGRMAAGLSVSEEVVERSIHFASTWLTTNVLSTLKSSNVKEESAVGGSGSGTGRTKAKSVKSSSDLLHRKLVAEVVSYGIHSGFQVVSHQ